MENKLLITKDDSHTIYSERYGAHYHSLYGSLEESIHVFISAGLYHMSRKDKKDLSIFEMGFGTGLNAYLTWYEAHQLDIKVDYTSVESDPISESIYSKLNYTGLLAQSDLDLDFQVLHTNEWATSTEIDDRFHFTKFETRIEDFEHKKSYDMIYFDAFAPSCQPLLWEAELHQKLYDQLNPGGILVTYCTQGQFKRTLKSLGYQLEKLNGPAKKREMLRATKT